MTKLEFKKLFAIPKALWYISKETIKLEISGYIPTTLILKEEPVDYYKLDDKKKLRYVYARLRWLKKKKSKWLANRMTCKPVEAWFVDEQLGEIEEQIDIWERKKHWLRKPSEQQTSVDFEKLKQIRLEDITGHKPIIHRGDTKKYLCPVHKEKTPSMVYSEKTKKYHCFGCGFHGDLLDLYGKINNLSVSETIKQLNY